MRQQEVLKKAIAFAIIRWHGQASDEILNEANGLVKFTFHLLPQVMSQLEAMDRTIDWPVVWSSLLRLTVDQLYELLKSEDLSVEDITASGVANVIEGLWDE